ncbi:phospholipase A2 inhibitor gamma subunit B-like [Neoarius graeffei]|uniref:phospholipase A2 inhibitor gamma subunit B-like n=1 Tax=Neoarius graeffei TaxID=443677 RepID=UPI00298C6E8C|nr:phospholipase A2 inhibitor gamma subunit B-like [Neoarius graeffei]
MLKVMLMSPISLLPELKQYTNQHLSIKMKLLLALYISFSLFFSVTMLDCLNCTSDSGLCNTTFSQQCPPGNSCTPLRYNYSVPGLNVKMIGEIHGCLPQAVCNQANPGVLETTYSANVGVASGFLSISCCESDNCNIIIIPEPDNKPNGLQCLSCKRLTDTTCTSSISCVGSQGHCMTEQVRFLDLANLTIKGCASKSFCDISFQNSTLGDVHCCSRNLCNGSEAWNRQDVGLLLMILTAIKLLQ